MGLNIAYSFIINPKFKILNSKQTQNATNSKPKTSQEAQDIELKFEVLKFGF
jgi:hypothetical protein